MQENQAQTLQLPSVEQMQQSLRQSGVLEKVTAFPQQMGAGVPQQTAAQQTQSQLATAEADDQLTAEAQFELGRLPHLVPKIVGFFLTLNSLRGMYTSVIFIFVEFPQLERALEQHIITSQEINTFVTSAVMTSISTALSLIFALRITIMKTKTAKILNTVIGISLLFGSTALEQYFNQITSGVEFADQSATMVEQATNFINNLFNR